MYSQTFRAKESMTWPQIQWLISGQQFLTHLSDLSQIGVAAYCQHCYLHGLPDAVQVVMGHDGLAKTSCAHTTKTVPLMTLRDTDTLLASLGWSLRCARSCAAQGMFDGVAAGNDPASTTVSVQCGCTTRIGHLPSPGV